MGAFAADRIQILQPFDPAVSETVCFPIPDNCWLESAELIMDAAISSGSLLFTLLARPGARVRGADDTIMSLVVGGRQREPARGPGPRGSNECGN